MIANRKFYPVTVQNNIQSHYTRNSNKSVNKAFLSHIFTLICLTLALEIPTAKALFMDGQIKLSSRPACLQNQKQRQVYSLKNIFISMKKAAKLNILELHLM